MEKSATQAGRIRPDKYKNFDMYRCSSMARWKSSASIKQLVLELEIIGESFRASVLYFRIHRLGLTDEA